LWSKLFALQTEIAGNVRRIPEAATRLMLADSKSPRRGFRNSAVLFVVVMGL
jgi:hypothetical protein